MKQKRARNRLNASMTKQKKRCFTYRGTADKDQDKKCAASLDRLNKKTIQKKNMHRYY